MTKLFIVGFPRDMGEIELVEMFSVHGTVNMVTIITDKDTGQSKCYGFVTMNDQQGAERAISAMNGTTIDDRKISVRFAENKGETKPVPVMKTFQKHLKTPMESAHTGREKKRPRRGLQD